MFYGMEKPPLRFHWLYSQSNHNSKNLTLPLILTDTPLALASRRGSKQLSAAYGTFKQAGKVRNEEGKQGELGI